jgi:hypothetical protein
MASSEEIRGQLLKINEIIMQLDESIRREAFGLLLSAEDLNLLRRVDLGTGGGPGESDESDRETFFGSRPQGKPADNAHLLVAWLYARGGAEFDVAGVRELAEDVGVTIPERVDVTFNSAQREGRPLYRSLGKGRYRITVHGETFLRNEFEVKRGNGKKARPE